MQDIAKVIENLEISISKLLERQDFLRAENDYLKNQMTQLQQELNVKNQQLGDLGQQLQSLKVAKTIQGSDDYSKETTQRINTLVKEIDWCIAQLGD